MSARPHVRVSSAVGVRCGAIGGQVRESAGPVGAVGLVAVRFEVGRLVGDETAQGRGGHLGRVEVLAPHRAPVEVGHGAGENGAAEAVDGYVVEPHVPVVQSVADAEQGEVVGRGLDRVDGGHVVGQVAFDRADGVVGIGQVDPAEQAGRVRGAADDTLADRAVLGDEHGVEAVAQCGGPVERGGE